MATTPELLTSIGTGLGVVAIAFWNAWSTGRAKQATSDTNKRLEGGNSAFAELRQQALAQAERIAALEVRISVLERMTELEQLRARQPPDE